MDGFNQFFSQIGQQLASNINQAKFTDNHFSKYLGQKMESNFTLLPVTIARLLDITKNLKNKNSAGADLVSNSLLKLAIPILAEPLKKLFDLSFSTGFVPHQIRIAKVIPLHKEGDRRSFNNYRPIAIISSIGKLLEKVVHHQLYGYLEINDILSSSQFGFRTHHGVEHPLVLFSSRVTNSLNRGLNNMSLFIDLKKAFDTVNFTILLAKLEHYGIRGVSLSWFKNYLVRFQCVLAGGVLSDIVDMLCGIPQGTVLGPLLFLLFVNDLALATTLLSLLFADDCTLQGEHENLSELFSMMNEQLGVAEKWFSANLLTLNIKKTKFILFTPLTIIIEDMPELRIGSEVIERVGIGQKEGAVRFLGIWIDEALSYKHHINVLKGKLGRGLHALTTAKNHSPLSIRKTIYYSLFESLLRFGCLLFGCATASDLRDVEIMQKQAIRLVAGAPYRAHTDPLFQSLRILKFRDLVLLERAVFVHKFRHNKLPKSFLSNFLEQVDCTDLSRRQDPGFYIPPTNNHLLTSRSPVSGMVNDWNSLPFPTKLIACHKAFKSEIIESFINSYTFYCTTPNCRSCGPP